MTYQEAKGKIQTGICCEKPIQHFCRDACLYGDEHCAFALAIAALEKQIPKKLKFVNRGLIQYCPCCNKPIAYSQQYCPNCGQAIDWSEK